MLSVLYTCYVLYVQYMIVHKVVVFHHAIVRWSFSFSQHTYIRASYVVGQSTVCSIGKYITDDVQTAKTCISMSSSDILNVPSFDNITKVPPSQICSLVQYMMVLQYSSALVTGAVMKNTTVATTVFSHWLVFVASCSSHQPGRATSQESNTVPTKWIYCKMMAGCSIRQPPASLPS